MSTSRKTFPVYNSNGALASGAAVKAYVTGETPASHPSGEFVAAEVGSSGVFWLDLDNGAFDFYVDAVLYAHNTNRWVGGIDLPDKASDETITGTWGFPLISLGTANAGFIDAAFVKATSFGTVTTNAGTLGTMKVDLMNVTSGTVDGLAVRSVVLPVGGTIFGFGNTKINVAEGTFFGSIYSPVATFGTILNLATGGGGGGGSTFGEILIGTRKVFGKDYAYAATELFTHFELAGTFQEEYQIGSVAGAGLAQGLLIKSSFMQNATQYRLFQFNATVDDASGTLTNTELRFGIWGGTFDANSNQYANATTMIGNGRYNEMMFLGKNKTRLHATNFTVGTRDSSGDYVSISLGAYGQATIWGASLNLSSGNGWTYFQSAVEFTKGDVYSKNFFSAATMFTSREKYVLGSGFDTTATYSVTNLNYIGTFKNSYQFSGDLALTVPRGVNVHDVLRAGTVEAEYLTLKATTSMDFNTLDTFYYKLGFTGAATESIEIGDSGASIKIENGAMTLNGLGTFGFGTVDVNGLQPNIQATQSSNPGMFFQVPTVQFGTVNMGTWLFQAATTNGTLYDIMKLTVEHGSYVESCLSVHGSFGGLGTVNADIIMPQRITFGQGTNWVIYPHGTTLDFYIDGTRAGWLDPSVGWVNG